MKKYETNTCYHCNEDGKTPDHVPPKCLFPDGPNWSQMTTVPSCEAHNEPYSKADEYLKFVLGASTLNAPKSVRGDVARGIVRLALLKSRNLHRQGMRWEGDELVIGNDFELDFELLSVGLKKIARGIYFHHHQGRRKLLGELNAWPSFIPEDPTAPSELVSDIRKIRIFTDADFKELPKHGEYQDIFAYQVIENTKTVIVNMEFYGINRASVMGNTA